GYLKKERLIIESYLSRDPRDRIKFSSKSVDEGNRKVPTGGRYARSYFQRVEVYGDCLTLVRVRLDTGRTHQIRVHAKELKHPVVGDLVYHHPLKLVGKFTGEVRAHLQRLKRQMLHAEVLGFVHPTTGENLVFKAPWPEDLRETVERL